MGRPRKYNLDPHMDEVIRLYVQEKLSLREIARRFEVPAIVVSRELKKREIPIRNISTAMTLSHLRKSQQESGEKKTTGVMFDDDHEIFKTNGRDGDWLDEV